MSEGPPPTRDDFVSEWDKCVYLLDHLNYWFWEEEDQPKAREYAGRLADVLAALDPHGTTWRGAEGWALVMATEGRWQECLEAKRHHIDITRVLLASRIDPDVMDGQDLVIVTEEFVLLARAAGNVEAADRVVAEVLRDGFFDAEQRAFLRGLRSGSGEADGVRGSGGRNDGEG